MQFDLGGGGFGHSPTGLTKPVAHIEPAVIVGVFGRGRVGCDEIAEGMADIGFRIPAIGVHARERLMPFVREQLGALTKQQVCARIGENFYFPKPCSKNFDALRECLTNTINAAGTANPSAHGQAMMSTLHTALASRAQTIADSQCFK